MTPFQRALLSWFQAYQRPMPWRNTSDPYAIWVSEVMLQQTRVETVIPYFERFMTAFPTVRHLAVAPLDNVLKLWEGLGYYARARNLQQAAKTVVSDFHGKVPNEPERFLQLKGVGPYIGAAVQSIAFGGKVAAVDGNVKRVLSRVTLCRTPVNGNNSHREYQRIADSFLNHAQPGDHNQAMMELGARICTPRQPSCDGCPVAAYCAAAKNDVQGQLPVRLSKKRVPTRHIAVAVIQKGDTFLITKRKNEGLLGGLWEFPGGSVETGESAADACLREVREEVNLRVRIERPLTTVHHAYTHFKIKMD
ncbi:MAG: A/G-specific adenine glycosylase, partial [Deltaproteobacteria bacterium]|nr:A/G-specific adenine glycosylase [Deltaproteobacteria bacterium]MBN2671858.1 A/G-specific adenine glycosylase [Deltaproteobacteria bacterium]